MERHEEVERAEWGDKRPPRRGPSGGAPSRGSGYGRELTHRQPLQIKKTHLVNRIVSQEMKKIL